MPPNTAGLFTHCLASTGSARVRGSCGRRSANCAANGRRPATRGRSACSTSPLAPATFRFDFGRKRIGRGSRWKSKVVTSVRALDHARVLAAKCRANVEFFTIDLVTQALPDGYDVITSSLFLHHLDEGQAIALLRKMRAAAGRLALVNDLARGRSGWLAALLGSRLLTRSLTVRIDALLSVEGAFTPSEALEMARRAGWIGVKLYRKFPFRYLLAWRRP